MKSLRDRRGLLAMSTGAVRGRDRSATGVARKSESEHHNASCPTQILDPFKRYTSGTSPPVRLPNSDGCQNLNMRGHSPVLQHRLFDCPIRVNDTSAVRSSKGSTTRPVSRASRVPSDLRHSCLESWKRKSPRTPKPSLSISRPICPGVRSCDD